MRACDIHVINIILLGAHDTHVTNITLLGAHVTHVTNITLLGAHDTHVTNIILLGAHDTHVINIIPYSGKLSREKTFANRLKRQISRRKLLRIVQKKFYKEEKFCGLVRQPLFTWPYQSMCVDEMETYVLETVVRGYRAYKELWELALSPCLQAVIIDEESV